MLSRVLGILALFTFASVFSGQTADATLTGYVTDASGSAVPGAKVTLKNSATQVFTVTQTNESGLYSFSYVVPGMYELSVEATGFQPQTHPAITVSVGLSVRTDFSLQVGTSQQSVTVTGGAQLLQTDNATIGTVISPRQVNELPLNGRNPLAFVALAPGVIPQGQAQQNAAGTNNSLSGITRLGVEGRTRASGCWTARRWLRPLATHWNYCLRKMRFVSSMFRRIAWALKTAALRAAW